MRGHFIAADASYQSQRVPDKSALLEIIFSACSKSAAIIHPYTALLLPGVRLRKNLTYLTTSRMEINFWDHHSGRASTSNWQPRTVHRKMYSITSSTEDKSSGWAKADWQQWKDLQCFKRCLTQTVGLCIQVNATILNHHIYIFYIWYHSLV